MVREAFWNNAFWMMKIIPPESGASQKEPKEAGERAPLLKVREVGAALLQGDHRALVGQTKGHGELLSESVGVVPRSDEQPVCVPSSKRDRAQLSNSTEGGQGG